MDTLLSCVLEFIASVFSGVLERITESKYSVCTISFIFLLIFIVFLALVFGVIHWFSSCA